MNKLFLILSTLIFLLSCEKNPSSSAPVWGCMDNTACNYNASATDDDGSCVLLDGICETCSEDGLSVVDNDSDDDGVCDADEVAGCQDSTACNYDSSATDEADSYKHLTLPTMRIV